MEFDNATNLDRKSGVRGTMMICFHCFPRRTSSHLPPKQKQWWASPFYFVPRTLGRTWGTQRFA
jgi:hypothetical protein